MQYVSRIMLLLTM